jgi:hypoxanthine phosphoribosyltransferase
MTTLAVDPAFDAPTIRKAVDALAERITADLREEGDALLISLLGGSVIFLADLVRAIRRPLRYEFILVERSESEQEDEAQQIYFPIPVTVRDQKVILVKDVVSTGVIETYLTEQLQQLGARGVRVAALVDMPQERRTAFSPDYLAFNVERQGTLVGYGLKSEGEGGNLPYMGWLETRS